MLNLIRLPRLLAASFVIASCAAPVWAGDVYSVDDVPVEASAASANAARITALREGHALALARLFRRLTLPEVHHLLPDTRTIDAQKIARSFEVVDEKTSQTRYIARLSVQFAPDQVRALLREQNMPFAEIQARPALLLIVEEEGDRVRLWGEDARWRRVFAGFDPDNSLTPLFLPAGDAGDIIALPNRQASAARLARAGYDPVFALMRRYQTGHALLVFLRPGENNISVTMGWLRTGAPPDFTDFTLPATQDRETDYRTAAALALRIVSDSWKRRVTAPEYGEEERSVQIAYGSLREWVEIQRRLRAVAPLREYRLRQLSSRRAHLDIKFSVPPDILALALAQQDIILDYQSLSWVMYLNQTRR